MGAENKNLFSLDGNMPGLGVGWHNVGKVLRASDPLTVKGVEHQYGSRIGHFPEAKQVALLVRVTTPEIEAHVKYISETLGIPIRVISPDQLRQLVENADDTVVVPYINTPENRHVIDNTKVRMWGLPPEMVSMLKNKAESNTDIAQKEISFFRVPECEVCDISDLDQVAPECLSKIENAYAEIGMQNDYPLGIVIRFAESDGGYGNAEIYDEAGEVRVIINGNIAEPQHRMGNSKSADSWKEAIAYAKNELLKSMNTQKESRVVVSRRIDFADSPGLSLVIVEGEVLSLGWNGQVLRGKSCVGTCNYEPKNEHTRRMQEEYEGATTEAFEYYLRTVADDLGIDFRSITGVVNADLLIPGELEREFLRRTERNSDEIYVVEINPRFTNWTDALLLVAWLQKYEKTFNGLRQARNRGVLTIDKYKNGSTIRDIEAFREGIIELDGRLKRLNGSRAYLRMPTSEPGLVIVGDVEHVRREIDLIARQQHE